MLEAGTRLGPYEILALQGAGGMGEVYRARDTRLNRTVALKVVSPAWSNSEEGRRRFEREAKVVSQISHPNVCALFDVGRAEDREFLVMEFVEGETLQARLERGPFPQHDVISLGQAIASGLDAAHREGVVHRDLKPGNIILSRNGVKILDFGLARTLADEPSAADETRVFNTGMAGTVLGTLPYMAPEQLQGRRVDARTDVFALGAVLYEMATGRRAFDATSQAGIIAAVLDHQPPAASATHPGVSPLLDRAIAQCLAKDPHARPQTAGEVARTLAIVGDPAPAQAAPRAGLRRERLVWIGALVLATLALLLTPRFRARTPAVSPQPLVIFDIPLPTGGQLRPVPDIVISVAMSPDGRHIVYPLTIDNRSQLWLHSLDANTARPLPGTEGAHAAFWSPTSRHIAFFIPGFLKRVSIDSEIVAPICATTTQVPAGSWGPDDTIVFSDPPALMRVPADGGTAEPLPLNSPLPTWPNFLPDGRHLLLLSPQGILRGALDGNALTPVVDVRSMAQYVPSGHLLYARDSSLLAHAFDPDTGKLSGEARLIRDGLQYFAPTGGASFSASATGALVFRRTEAVPRRLAWIGRDGREQTAIAPDEPWIFSPRLSPDGQHVAVSMQSPRSGSTDLRVFDLRTGTPVIRSDDLILDNWMTWWPDGRSLIVSRNTDTSPPQLFRRHLADASEPVPLIPGRTTRNLQYRPDVLFDGRAVAFGQDDDIWLWRVGAPDVEPLVKTPYVENNPAFSPDGRWLAYDSNTSGRDEVYVQPFGRPGDSIRVSNAGGSAPRWRENGQELFFLDLEGQIMAVALTTDKHASKLVRVTSGKRIEGFDVAPDGSRFVAVLPLSNPSPPSLTVVMNWQTLMK